MNHVFVNSVTVEPHYFELGYFELITISRGFALVFHPTTCTFISNSVILKKK